MSSEETGSYRIGEARFRDASAELERLRVQADVLWPHELPVLERHGLRADASVLEAGCGPGFVTAHLLDHVREGSVTALDVDPAMLAHARELVRAVERVRFVEASVAATGLPDAAFDVVLARFLLQHVPDVPGALLELKRILRPGGHLIVVDADLAFSTLFDPEPPFTRELMDAVVEGQRRQGGDGRIGRKVPALLRDAGVHGHRRRRRGLPQRRRRPEAIRAIIPDQALDHLEAGGLISAGLATAARDYLARVDSGEQPYEGMEISLVASGSA